ncbi:MAG: hypothetical protein LH650_13465 [Chloroflexi bacterium]|nr:hypothetical protein [Chloroflexota bacterium]
MCHIRCLGSAVCDVLGLFLSFSFFTLASYQIVSALHLPSDSLRTAAILVIAFFGCSLIFPAIGRPLERALSRLPGMGDGLAHCDRLGGLITGDATPAAGHRRAHRDHR